MEELLKMALDLKKMTEENKVMSIIRGNRNWEIKTTNYNGRKCAYVGRHGAMKRNGQLGAFIRDIGKYNIRWYTYTYKKDFDDALTMLEKNNYEIWWEQ